MAARPHIIVDAQLSPSLARWIGRTFDVTSSHVDPLRGRGRSDADIFRSARQPATIILSKDEDFVYLVRRHRAPPAIIWLRSRNRSDAQLQRILLDFLPTALSLIKAGESMVQIADPQDPPPSPTRRR